MRSNFSSRSLSVALVIIIIAFGAKAGINIWDGVNELTQRHTPTLTILQTMESDVLEGIEEAFAYTVLNNELEKQEFEERMADFDVSAAAFQAIAGSQDEEVAEELDTYTSIVQAKEDLVEAANLMFVDFENLGTTSSRSVGAFETNVEQIAAAFEELVEIERVELEEHVVGLERTVLIEIGLLLIASVLLLIVLLKGDCKRS